MKKRTELKGLYWEYCKLVVMRKTFLSGSAILIVMLLLMTISLIPSYKDPKQEAARIISAGVFESKYSPKSRYKVETFDGKTYFIVENSNRGLRDIDRVVCLQFYTRRIIGSQVVTITGDKHCPETSQ